MALLLRLNKAAPLTNAEVDNNFLYLESLITGIQNSKLSISNLLLHIKQVDGQYSGIDADLIHGMLPTDQPINSSIVARDATGNFSANVITASLLGNAATATTATNFNGIIPITNGGSGVNALSNGHISSNGINLTSATTIPGSDISGNIPGLSYGVTGIIDIAHGGTGANSVGAVQVALSLIPGQTIQPYATNLTNLAGVASFGFLVHNDTIQTRNIEVGNSLQITNAGGVNGNPKIELTVVSITNGGTGSNNAPAALAALGGLPINSPGLQGIPTAPTATPGTKTNQIATTEFVMNVIIPSGTIVTMARTTAPNGFLLTDGTVYFSADYPTLYATVGTRFGTGGPGTFFVPHITPATGFISVIKI